MDNPGVMKKTTALLCEQFEEITGVKPISGRKETGSMKQFVRFRFPYSKDLDDFTSIENFLRKEIKNFKGVQIRFCHSDYNIEDRKNNGFELHVRCVDEFGRVAGLWISPNIYKEHPEIIKLRK